jgi:Domain of unknown function (DUF1990)
MKLRPCALGPGLSVGEAKMLSRNFTNERDLPERSTSIALGVAGPIAKWRTDFLFDYDIFPSSIMRFDAEWPKHGRGMMIGDVILQRAVLPPIGVGFCLEFAVRICEIIREQKRVGFAYETLKGHAESGISEFYFEERSDGLFFTIHTFSQPGHWTARIVKYVATLPYQAWCTRRALEHVYRRFRSTNKLAA